MSRAAVRPIRVNHMNAVVRNFDTAIAHMQAVYGAEFMVDMPQKEFHACLFAMGQVIFELFVPWDFLVSARIGPHHVGLEWQADMDAVRAALADHKIGTIRDIGLALHTDPADCFGVAHEFYAGSFHKRDWPLLGGPIKPATYWRDEHALGLAGLGGYTHIVEDLEAASAFLQSFLGAELLFNEPRPEIGARARGLRIADATVEVLAPDGEGWLAEQLRRQGQGILSTVLRVHGIDKARDHLVAQGITPTSGTCERRIAVQGHGAAGLMFEFAAG